MQTIANEKSEKGKIIQLVVFHVRDEEFGVPIEEIQEIIKVNNITPIPDTPAFIKGIINVRGDIVTTIDMKVRFGIRGKKLSNSRHILITKQSESLFGLMVDEVTEVLRINENEIKPPPAMIVEIEKEYVKGIVVYEERLLIILDLSKVLSQDEFFRLSEIARKHIEELPENDTIEEVDSEDSLNEETGNAETNGKKDTLLKKIKKSPKSQKPAVSPTPKRGLGS